MSSSDHLHPQQLQMFMPARKLKGMTPSDFNPQLGHGRHHGTLEGMWSNKLDTAKMKDYNEELIGSSLYDSIASEGVKEPVQVTRTAADFGEGTIRAHLRNQDVLFDGHHRVATAANIDPNMEVPVEHFNIRVH